MLHIYLFFGLFVFRLDNIEMDYASEEASGDIAYNVEQCQCPPNYEGTSCEVSGCQGMATSSTQQFEIQLSMSSHYASHNQVDISGNYSEIFWYNSHFPCDLSLISSGIMTNH